MTLISERDYNRFHVIANDLLLLARGEFVEEMPLSEILDAVEQALTNRKRLNTAIEALRQIPSWASILLATDSPPPRYIVRITEGDVGGDEILSTGDDDLVTALEAAHAQYLLYNREYAHKLGVLQISKDQTLTPADIARGQQLAREFGMLDDDTEGDTNDR